VSNRFLAFAWTLLVASLLAVVPAAAQTDARIVGSVRDQSGALVPGAGVTVVNHGTGQSRTTVSNDDGFFVVTGLKPAIYTVRVVSTNFAPTEYTDMKLQAAQELSLDFEIRPQGVTESVTVSANSSALDLSSARIGTNVIEREVKDLPLNGRQLSQLHLQAPGSVNSGTGTFGDIRFSGQARAEHRPLLRVDQKLNANWSMYARYVRDQGTNEQPEGVTGRRSHIEANPSNGLVALQGVLSASMLNELKFGYNAAPTSIDGIAPTVNGIGNTAGSNEALTAGNPFDYDYDIGYNAFDVRHTFNVSALYALSIRRGPSLPEPCSGVTQAIPGGWDVGAIVNARSGLPIDVRVTRPDVVYVDASGNVFGSPAAGGSAIINTLGGGASRNVRRPNLIPGVDPYVKNGLQWLNPAAFSIPAPGEFGNLKRGELRGPTFKQVDFLATKRFEIAGSSNVEVRWEVFNLFNTDNFANPVATLPSALGTGANQIQPEQPLTSAAAGTFGSLTSTSVAPLASARTARGSSR
jgi:hypothetical protein